MRLSSTAPFAILRALAIFACVAFVASALVQHLAARYLLDDATLARIEKGLANAKPLVPPSKSQLATSAEQPRASDEPREIAGVIFCPTCQPVVEAAEELDPRLSGGRSVDDDGDPGIRPSKRPFLVTGTMISDDAGASMVVLEHETERYAVALRVGEELESGVSVEDVGPRRVVLNAHGVLEFLDMDGNDCTPEYPCGEGMGDCNEDADCQSGLVCGARQGINYGLNPNDDVCVPPACNPNPNKPFARPFCNETCRCTNGFGDCDGDEECLPGHKCGDDNGPRYGQPHDWDICVAIHCFNKKKDADETEVDCGGSKCGPCPAW